MRMSILLLVLAVLGARPAVAAPAESTSSGQTMLRQAGLRIVDAGGRPVVLRGVNLGGWLTWEGWMFGGGFTSESEIMKRLATAAGPEAARQFQRGIHEQFVNEDDLRRIAQLGFNAVRVPLNGRVLGMGPHGPAGGEAGWALLDRTLDACEKYRLYAILDLHAAPGGQSTLFMADPGDTTRTLWQSEDHKQQTVALWRAIAARYKGRACVAGYDLLNEPAAPADADLVELYRRLIAAVRAEDAEHMIFIEGAKFASDFSMFAHPPCTNMVYAFHIYNWFGDDRKKKLDAYEAIAQRQNIPFWGGEFGQNSYAMIQSTVEMFEARPTVCGWGFWSWKQAPGHYPGLVTIKMPLAWESVINWVTHPLFHRQPTEQAARYGMDVFLKAVKLPACDEDPAMKKALRLRD